MLDSFPFRVTSALGPHWASSPSQGWPCRGQRSTGNESHFGSKNSTQLLGRRYVLLVVYLNVSCQRMCREALSHSSPPPRGQASCNLLHGRVTRANSASGLGKLLGTVLESVAVRLRGSTSSFLSSTRVSVHPSHFGCRSSTQLPARRYTNLYP